MGHPLMFSCCLLGLLVTASLAQAASLDLARQDFELHQDLSGLQNLAPAIETRQAGAMELWASKGQRAWQELDGRLGAELPTPVGAAAVRDRLRAALQNQGLRFARVWLVGDSTVVDYTVRSDYQTKYYPISGWGEHFLDLLEAKGPATIKRIFSADVISIVNRSKGGRSTRTYWEEGSWKPVQAALAPGDTVFVQFGHNDASSEYPDRYVPIEGYKNFLNRYVEQIRAAGAKPILVTPVNRNYPWDNPNRLANSHGAYPEAVRVVASAAGAGLVDLSAASLTFFSAQGKDYVHDHYFMIFPANQFASYPRGSNDNTHFRIEGAREVARLVVDELVRNAKP